MWSNWQSFNLSLFGRWESRFPCLICPIAEAKLLFSCAATCPTHTTGPADTGDGGLSPAYYGVFCFYLRLQWLVFTLYFGWICLLPKARTKQAAVATGQQNQCSCTAWCALNPGAVRTLCWAGAGAGPCGATWGHGLWRQLPPREGVCWEPWEEWSNQQPQLLPRSLGDGKAGRWSSRVLPLIIHFQTAGVCLWKLPAPALPSAASEVGMTLAPHPGKLQNSIDRGLGPAHFGASPFHCPVFPGLLPSQCSRSLWDCYIWASVEDRSSSHTQGDVP